MLFIYWIYHIEGETNVLPFSLSFPQTAYVYDPKLYQLMGMMHLSSLINNHINAKTSCNVGKPVHLNSFLVLRLCSRSCLSSRWRITSKISQFRTFKLSWSRWRRSSTPRLTHLSGCILRSEYLQTHAHKNLYQQQLWLVGFHEFFFFCLQQGDCVISKVLTFDLSAYPDANPNPNE